MRPLCWTSQVDDQYLFCLSKSSVWSFLKTNWSCVSLNHFVSISLGKYFPDTAWTNDTSSNTTMLDNPGWQITTRHFIKNTMFTTRQLSSNPNTHTDGLQSQEDVPLICLAKSWLYPLCYSTLHHVPVVFNVFGVLVSRPHGPWNLLPSWW